MLYPLSYGRVADNCTLGLGWAMRQVATVEKVRTSNFEVRRAAAPLYPLGASLRKGLRYDGTVNADQQAIRERFSSALDALVDHVKADRSILAVLLCGSLSHDVVWEKSDIDLMLVTVDDKHIKTSDLPLYADGVNVHAALVPRAEFRKMVDGSLQHSFIHSFLSKGRLLYTHDETIAALCERLKDVGRRDTELQLFRAASHALPPIDKARKWFVTRRDLDYSALWILYAATPLAQIEVISRRLVPDREVIPQAATLNPAFFDVIYTGCSTPGRRPRPSAARSTPSMPT